MNVVESKKLNKKIKSISNKLLLWEACKIVLKSKLSKDEDTVQKYFDMKVIGSLEKMLNDMNLEFGMAKYLLKHSTRVKSVSKETKQKEEIKI